MSEVKVAPLIYLAMTNAMNQIGAISKGQTNKFQNYKFRGIDDVMNALYPVLVENHLFLVPELVDKQIETLPSKDGKTQVHALLTMRYTMYAQDGSSVSATTLGEGLDTSDKACNKAMAVAMKYAMFQMFCIPTEEMRNADPDNYNPQYGGEQQEQNDICEDCGKAIEGRIINGVPYEPKTLAFNSVKKYGKVFCFDCMMKRKAK